MNKKLLAIFFAILAAGLYAINIPLSKLLLNHEALFIRSKNWIEKLK